MRKEGGSGERKREIIIIPKKVSPVFVPRAVSVSPTPEYVPQPVPPKESPRLPWTKVFKPYVPGPKTPGFEYGGKLSSEDADVAKKAARVAAIKAAALNDKKYNVGTSTTADSPLSASPVTEILYGGGGGGGYAEATPGGGFSFSDIPSVVWIILAVGVGWFVVKSSKRGRK